MTIRTLLRRLPFLVGISLASLLTAWMVLAQTNEPLTSKWSPGAIPGGGGIAIAPEPIITGEPFTADNNSRSVQMQNGRQVIHESHGIIARDSLGRIATRTPASPHVAFPDGRSSVFALAGGRIEDPTTGFEMRWSDNPAPQLNKVVMKSRMFPSQLHGRSPTLDPCKGEGNQTRNLPNGETRRFEDLGERTIQNVVTHGCRVTTTAPAGLRGNDEPLTSTDEWWTSPDLRVVLLHTRRSPNEMVRDEIAQLDNIVLGEPDPTLFEPPPGYEVRDMDAERERNERAMYTVQPGEPEAKALAGAWEGDDPFSSKPAQMGMMLKIQAERRLPINNKGKPTADGPQRFAQIEIHLYQRGTGEDRTSLFYTGNSGVAPWDGHRLRIEADGAGPYSFYSGHFVLDLNFNMQKGSWAGSYTRDAVTKPIQFARPGSLSKPSGNPFRGVWSVSNTQLAAVGTSQCLNIVEGSDGALVAWRDTTGAPMVDARISLNIGTFVEFDGDAVGTQADGDTLTLLYPFYKPGGYLLPQKFTGNLTSDGTQITGTWKPISAEGWPGPPAEGQLHSTPAPTTTFTRLTGQSCW